MTITNPTFESGGKGWDADAVERPIVNQTAVTIAAQLVNRRPQDCEVWIKDYLNGAKHQPGTVPFNAVLAYRAAVVGIESCQEQTRPFLAVLLHDDDGGLV